MFSQTGSESGTADTGGSLSHSTSSLDRDDSVHQQQVRIKICSGMITKTLLELDKSFLCFSNQNFFRQEQQFQQELVEFEQEKQVAEMREKSTPEKVKENCLYFQNFHNYEKLFLLFFITGYNCIVLAIRTSFI